MPINQYRLPEEVARPPFWSSKRWWSRALVLVGAVVLLSLTIVLVGYPKFKNYRQRNALRSAENYFQAKDYRSAYLLLDGLTQREPGNFEARRLFARVLDNVDSAQALVEWESLTKLEPGNPANYVGCATLGLRLGKLDLVQASLAGLKKVDPASADYHRLSAAEALARRDSAALRQAMEGLVQAEPDSAVSRFGLATLRLDSTAAAEVETARSTLEEFARGDELRIRATLALLSDAPRRWPGKSSGQMHRLLARQLGLGVATRAGTKQYLWAGLKNQHEPDLEDVILHMQEQPAPKPEDISRLAGWLVGQQRAREALAWLESLDVATKATPPVLNALANCATTAGQWDDLEKFLEAGAWGAVSPEVIRYAFDARRVREAGYESQSESLWNSAVLLAQPSLPGLRVLGRLASRWQWPRKQEQALWALVQQFPAEQETWQKLCALALSAKDEAKAWRVYCAWASADPTNREVQLNRAVLGAFVRPAEPGLQITIEEINRREPANPGGQLAQAMIYWRNNRSSEALALLDKIPIKSTAEPRLALARGLVLSTLGRAPEAEAAFGVVPEDALLPEEKRLLRQARRPNASDASGLAALLPPAAKANGH